MLFLSVASVYLVYITNNAKTNISRSINQEGVFALNQMEFVLRSASGAECSGNTITLTDISNQIYTIALGDSNTHTIAITKGVGDEITITTLTSNDFTAKACDSPDSTHGFECTSANGKDFVKVCFELEKLGLNIKQSFETQIQLRN